MDTEGEEQDIELGINTAKSALDELYVSERESTSSSRLFDLYPVFDPETSTYHVFLADGADEAYILAEAASDIMGLPYGGGSPQKWYEQNLSYIFPMIVDIEVRSANVTDTSLDFVIDLSYSPIDGEFVTGKAYTLEVYENGQYTAVQPIISGNMAFTSEAIPISEGENWLHVDWETFYGTLEKGKYRMGKEIGVSNPDGSQRVSSMFYTHFTIY